MKLFAAPRTRAIRILWLLEELEVEHELVMVEFKPTTDTFYIQDTPTGKIPTLEDGDAVICESGAMVQYIMEKHGNGRLEPALDAPERAAYLQWLHYAESSAFGPLGNIIWLTQYRDDAVQNADLIKDCGNRAQAALNYVETRLGDNEYLIGDQFTAADIMMGFTLLGAQMLGQLNADLPKLSAYLMRLMQRPALQKTIQQLS